MCTQHLSPLYSDYLKDYENANTKNKKTKAKIKFQKNLDNLFSVKSEENLKKRSSMMIGTITDLLSTNAKQCIEDSSGNIICPNGEEPTCSGGSKPNTGPVDCSKTTLFHSNNFEYKTQKNIYNYTLSSSIILIIIILIKYSLLYNANDDSILINHNNDFSEIIDPKPRFFFKNTAYNDDATDLNLNEYNFSENYNFMFPFIKNKFLLNIALTNIPYINQFLNSGFIIYFISILTFFSLNLEDIKKEGNKPGANNKNTFKNEQLGYSISIGLLVLGISLFILIKYIPNLSANNKINISLKVIIASIIATFVGFLIYGFTVASEKTQEHSQKEKKCNNLPRNLFITALILIISYFISFFIKKNFNGPIKKYLNIINSIIIILLFGLSHSFNLILIGYYPSLFLSGTIIQNSVLSLLRYIANYINNDYFYNNAQVVANNNILLFKKFLRSMAIDQVHSNRFQFIFDFLLYGLINGYGINELIDTDDLILDLDITSQNNSWDRSDFTPEINNSNNRWQGNLLQPIPECLIGYNIF